MQAVLPFALIAGLAMDGPIGRAVTRQAVRLASEDPAMAAVVSSAPQSWERVLALQPGTEIILTLVDSGPGRRFVLRADPSEVVVLDLAEPAVTRDVAAALLDAASAQPDAFARARAGGHVRLSKHVRLAPDGVFEDGQKIVELQQIVKDVPRGRVTEVRALHRAVKRGLLFGAAIGAAAAIGTIFARCGTQWNTETESCGNLEGAILFVGPAFGLGIGAAAGASFKVPTLVYRAP